VIRTLTRRVGPWLGALAVLVGNATCLYAQKASPKAAPPPESGGFIGEFILAFVAVGLVLYAVCAPSDKAT
jgi:hypothetical protein